MDPPTGRSGPPSPTSPRPALGLGAIVVSVVIVSTLAVLVTDLTGSLPDLLAAGPAGTADPPRTAGTMPASPTTSSPATSTPGPSGIAPAARPFALDLYREGTFVSQIDREHCLPAAFQIMLDLIGPTLDRSQAAQEWLLALTMARNTPSDSRDGGPGPLAWAATLRELGAGDYRVVVFDTLADALRAAVLALEDTGRPVGIMAWWGAHAWVLTGFEASGDPAADPSAVVTGYRIVDPFYPRRSTIWGQTLPPDSLRSPADMVHNLPAWTRPEGAYPGRDGKWLMVLPVGELVPRLGPLGPRA